MVQKGGGIPMLVNSDHYNTITKTFDSNKGLRFKLSADEMEANSKPESKTFKRHKAKNTNTK